ncbi:MAG: S-adenosylmethionine decarboxylase [Alphaproteobacteria bacterium]|nr:S-adenosylmethionine decarboxylase [Alphaproteobacteria bacterium]
MAVVHKHLIIRAEVGNPLKEEQVAIDWMNKLVNKIGMKVMMGPFAKYLDVEGNRGLTAVAIIETSHIALHVWDEDKPSLLQLDVYTCGPLDPYDVVEALREFHPVKIEMKYLDRENKLIELPLE